MQVFGSTHNPSNVILGTELYILVHNIFWLVDILVNFIINKVHTVFHMWMLKTIVV